MNKHGFTLVELLAAIALISILSTIAIISYTSIVNTSKLRTFQMYEETMHAEAISLFMDNPSLIPKNNETLKIFLSDMLEQKEIEPFNNPRNKDDLCLDSYINVTRNDIDSVNSLTYTVCLICKNSDYNVNGTSCETFEN